MENVYVMNHPLIQHKISSFVTAEQEQMSSVNW